MDVKVYPILLTVVWGQITKRKKILAGTSEWVMAGMGQCSETLQVGQAMSLRREEAQAGRGAGLGGPSAPCPHCPIAACVNGVSRPAFNSSLHLTSCVTVRKLLVLF